MFNDERRAAAAVLEDDVVAGLRRDHPRPNIEIKRRSDEFHLDRAIGYREPGLPDSRPAADPAHPFRLDRLRL